MAEDRLTADAIRRLLRRKATTTQNAFTIMKGIMALVSRKPDGSISRELVLRALNRKKQLLSVAPMLTAVTREVGLFPYVQPQDLGLGDQIAYEFHRPDHMPPDIVFHQAQARVYRQLVTGNNVILSAPTSFGKSLIIDAIIATRKFKNIVVVVPTIALIDETRRRLSRRFGNQFRIITHFGQEPSEKNIYVLTQERVLQFENLKDVDFFVIDEFYKLNPKSSNDDGRAYLLNQAFYKLLKQGGQFYMLGPSVKELAGDFSNRFSYEFMHEPFETVVSELIKVNLNDDENELNALERLCKGIKGPTVIFCSSPGRVRKVVTHLAAAGIYTPSSRVDFAADWIAGEYHPDWHVVKALRSGIGLHHARIPRALGQYIVRCFNEGNLNVLVCTSTLIEGVNTRAKNMVVLDHKIDKTPLDLFTFNNIRGRAGRMWEHFVGRVYIFHDEPQGELFSVDLPIFTQGASTPSSVLLQLQEEDITDFSAERLRKLEGQSALSIDTMRKCAGVEPENLIKLANHIGANAMQFHSSLNWRQFPNSDQLKLICEFMWNFFNARDLGRSSVRTKEQLNSLIRQLGTKSFSDLLDIVIRYFAQGDADEGTTRFNDFIRLWAQFNFPRLLAAIDLVQREVYGRLNMPAGNYEVYGAQVENLFEDPSLIALDEYGVPFQLAKKLRTHLATDGNLDEALQRLRELDLTKLNLDIFEHDILLDAQRNA